jgi:plastocyanin
MAPRARPVAIAAACWLLLLAGAARAVDDHGVSIKNTAFTDGASGTTTTTVAEGDSVTWHWDAPTGLDTHHSVTADAGQSMAFDSGSTHGNGDHFTVVFPTSGCFTYHCTIHATMHGTVIVGTGVCPPPSGGGGGGGGGGNGPPPPPPPASPGPDTTAPAFSAVKVKAKKLTFKLTEPAKVTIKVRKGHKLVKTFHLSGKKGSNSFRLTHRGLKTGVKYKAQVTAVDSAGNKSRLASVSVKL